MAGDDKIPGTGDNSFNYEPFANDPAYIGVNSSLVKLVNDALDGGLDGKDVADIAAGTGLIAKLCCELASPKYVACSDINPAARAVQEQTLSSFAGRVDFDFYTADAQSLPMESSRFHAAFGTNFIHNVLNKPAVISEAARILRPGGILGINTAFYDGCYVRDTGKEWGRWVALAMRYIRDSQTNEDASKKLVVERDHVEVTAREFWPTPNWYQSLLEQHGFKVVHLAQTPVRLSHSALVGIANYAEFAAGAFHIDPNVSRASEYVRNASTALTAVVAKAFSPEGVERNWLQIVAQKA